MTTWRNIATTGLPEPGVAVLVFFVNQHGKDRVIRAAYAAPHSLRLDDEVEGGCDCGECLDDDEVYCAAGWYETNEFEEVHWKVADAVTHWMPLPPAPTSAGLENSPSADQCPCGCGGFT
jgi:hypothetical protein